MYAFFSDWKCTAFKQISVPTDKIWSLISKFKFTSGFTFCDLVSYQNLYETKFEEIHSILPIQGFFKIFIFF